jgi:site-specific recombinase XerC
MTDLAPHLAVFLREHLPVERGASPHTCDTYAYGFQLLVCFAGRRLGVKPSKLEIEQLDAPLVLAFLEHLERERKNSARTRNARPGIPARILSRPVPSDPRHPDEKD